MKTATKQRLIIYSALSMFIVYMLMPRIQAKYFNNGFDLSNLNINADEIYAGGPVKDGIPSIDRPVFIEIKEVDFLQDEDRILALSIDGVHKAYPIKILNHHEIVNDVFSGKNVAVTYCPLCGSGTAFYSKGTFGVSGLLYNNDVLLYDRETLSLWSQILSQAVSGKLMGSRLKLLPLEHTSWLKWSSLHPKSLVLSMDTGFNRDYSQSPYLDYSNSEVIYFPLKNNDDRYHPKELIVGIVINNEYKAFPFVELNKHNGIIYDSVGGLQVEIRYDTSSNSAVIYDSFGNVLPTITSYWFAWMAFHPDSNVYVE